MHHDLSEGKVLSLHKSSFSFLFCASMRRQLAANGATVVVGGKDQTTNLWPKSRLYSAPADVRILKPGAEQDLLFLHLWRFNAHWPMNWRSNSSSSRKERRTKVKSNCKMHLEFVFLLTFCHQQHQKQSP